jgi:hypothetical protein
VSIVLAAGAAHAANLAWPSNSTGTNIGANLQAPFEPSGIVWDNRTGYLWLIDDEGKVARMGRDGSGTITWTPATTFGWEAVTVTGTTPLLYLGEEEPPTIHEYYSSVNSDSPSPTGKTWLLGMQYSSNSGMEGLTWVPNGSHPYPPSASGGLFYASSQDNGTIYVYNVNLSQSSTTALTAIASFTPDPQNSDVSDLYYSPTTRTLFVLYDTANKLVEIDISATQFQIINTYTLPTTTTGQEGVTLLPQCPGALTNIYLADDQGSSYHNVFLFNNFPQLCATVLAPTADATTNQGSPTTPYGTTATLIADQASGADRDFLIQYNLSGVTRSQIARAGLLFYVTDGTDKSPQFCSTSTSWTESSVTWNTQPACTSGTLQGGGATVGNQTWVSYDAASLLKSGSSSFRFVPQSSNDMVANSRQATSNPPQLILWLTGQ